MGFNPATWWHLHHRFGHSNAILCWWDQCFSRVISPNFTCCAGVLLVDQVVDLAPRTWPDAARTCKLEPVMIWGSRSSNVLRWLGAFSPWHWSRCFQRKERTPQAEGTLHCGLSNIQFQLAVATRSKNYYQTWMFDIGLYYIGSCSQFGSWSQVRWNINQMIETTAFCGPNPNSFLWFSLHSGWFDPTSKILYSHLKQSSQVWLKNSEHETI